MDLDYHTQYGLIILYPAVMICCLNPACSHPENPDGAKFCVSCGNPLIILRSHYYPIKLLSDEGGFGRTYLAEDRDKLGEKCVIKQLTVQQQGTNTLTKAKELFEGEARQLQKLGKHPQIPDLLAYFEEEGYLYLVQQYIEGKTLDKVSDNDWTEKEVKEFLHKILPVFDLIHQNKVIHRDIKPQNIMRQRADGNYILIDFGASREFQSTMITNRRTMIGTQGFSPIEQLQAGEAYPASDLYSLGMTCFYLLTQVDPYQLFLEEGYGWLNRWQSHLKQPISDNFKQVLDKLLRKDWEQRYQLANDVLIALKTPQQKSSSSSQQKPQMTVVSPPQQVVTSSQRQQKQSRRKLLKYLGYGGLGMAGIWLLSQLMFDHSSSSSSQERNSNRNLWQYLGYGSLGMTAIWLLSRLIPTSKDCILESFAFETVKVNAYGRIIKRTINKGKQFTIDLGNDIILEMVKIKTGTFIMGSPEIEEGRYSNESPQHQVIINDFYVGKYQITQEQWQAIMGDNPSYFQKGGKYPVEQVSWNDCQKFCKQLSKQTNLKFTLPSEAQWEYACRSISRQKIKGIRQQEKAAIREWNIKYNQPFYYGETLSTDIANYNGNYAYGQGRKGINREETTEVGSFPANGFGLYDMHGNVWEWCQDDYVDNYENTPADGKPYKNKQQSTKYAVLRCGSWRNSPYGFRSASRSYGIRNQRYDNVGFRVVYVVRKMF